MKKNTKITKSKTKNTKTVKPKSPKAAKKHRGRPLYQIKWPTGKFTFHKLMVLNGVDPKTGKSTKTEKHEKCTKLTLYKGLRKDLARKGHSFIIQLDDLADPSTGKLGRKQFTYKRRVQVSDTATNTETKQASEPVSAPVEAPATDVSVNVGLSQETQDYEAQKAALLAPDPAPAPVSTVPDVIETATETPTVAVVETAVEAPQAEAVAVEVAATPEVVNS